MIKYGDLQLIPNKNEYIIIACDSAGSIGDKPGDIVKTTPEFAGYFTAMVPIVEVLAIKGEIISIVDTLTVEMEPTGKRIISGIKDAMIDININTELLTGSTEENISSNSTGIGITVIGKISKEIMDQELVKPGMILLLAGIPKVGQQFLEEEIISKYGETITLELMKRFARDEWIFDMIPVGSKGIAYEADVLASRYKLVADFIVAKYKDKVINYTVSAGPATCVVIAMEYDNVKNFKQKYKTIPLSIIGRVR